MNLTFSWTQPRKLLHCEICGTPTVHAQAKSGDWVCGCSSVHPSETWTIGEQALPSRAEWDDWKDERNSRPIA